MTRGDNNNPNTTSYASLKDFFDGKSRKQQNQDNNIQNSNQQNNNDNSQQEVPNTIIANATKNAVNFCKKLFNCCDGEGLSK